MHPGHVARPKAVVAVRSAQLAVRSRGVEDAVQLAGQRDRILQIVSRLALRVQQLLDFFGGLVPLRQKDFDEHDMRGNDSGCGRSASNDPSYVDFVALRIAPASGRAASSYPSQGFDLRSTPGALRTVNPVGSSPAFTSRQ